MDCRSPPHPSLLPPGEKEYSCPAAPSFRLRAGMTMGTLESAAVWPAARGADEDVVGQQAGRDGRVRMIEALGRDHAHGGEVPGLAAGPGRVAAAVASQPRRIDDLLTLQMPRVAFRWPNLARSDALMTTHPGPLRTTLPSIS